MTKVNYLPAQYFYRINSVLTERRFFKLVKEKQIKYIDLFKNGRLYSVKDWDKKMLDKYKVGHLLEEIAR